MYLHGGGVLRSAPATLLVSLLFLAASVRAQDLETILRTAQTEQSSGQYGAAADSYALATAARSDSPELWANRGLMEYLSGRKTDAVSSFRRALALKSDLLTPLLFLGKAYNREGKPQAALPLLKRAQAGHPKDATVLVALGDTYRALSDPERAASAYRDATVVDPSSANAWFGLGVSSLTAIDENGRVLAARHSETVWARALLADELFAQGRSSEAIEHYNAATASATPDEAAILAKTVQQMLGNVPAFGLPDNAASAFQSLLPKLSVKARSGAVKCRTGKPVPVAKLPAALREEARCTFWRGEFERSATLSAKALAIQPGQPESLYWSIKANERVAVTALSQFENLAPDSAASHDLLGDLYRRRWQTENALREYEKALVGDPHDHAALIGKAAVFLYEGQLDEAISTAQAALTDHPEDPVSNLMVAEALVGKRNFEEAKPYLIKSLDSPPEQLGRVHALRGKVYASEGNTAAAIEEMKLALSADEDGSIHYQLARLYRKAGQVAEAEKAEAGVKALGRKSVEQTAVPIFHDSDPN